jgi:hypothetical protein
MGGRDLLFAVDQQLFDAGKVFVQSGLDFGSKQERPTNDTRIAVMAATSLTQESSRAAISGFLSNVGILLMDEAMNRSGGEHQRLVTKYSHDEKHPPIAVVSTAHDPKKNGGLGYDVKLSHFEAEMGVNTEPAILEPMRMKVVPHRGQILYRSGTFESALFTMMPVAFGTDFALGNQLFILHLRIRIFRCAGKHTCGVA